MTATCAPRPALRVLLVEDNPGDADLIVDRATEDEHRPVTVHVARTLASASAALAEEMFDLVLADLGLPDSAGLPTFAALSAAARGAPIVILTGSDDQNLADACVARGAQEYLVKGRVEGFFAGLIHNAVERSRLKSELLAAHTNLEHVIRDSDDGIIVLGTGDVIRFANPAALALFDGRLAVGEPFGYPVAGQSSAGRPADLDLTCRDGSLRHVEMRVGETIWHGAAARMLSLRDVTERRRTAETLRASEQRYRLLAENVTDVIWTSDLNLRFTDVSPSVTRLSGYSVAEAMQFSLDEILTPASAQFAFSVLAEELAPETLARHAADPFWSRTVELDYVRADRVVIPTEVKISPVRDGGGRPVGLLGITRDISGRKRAEAALREAEARYQTLVEHIPAITYLSALDANGSTLYVSPQIETVLGFSPAEWLVDPSLWARLLHPEDREWVLAAIGRVGSADETFQAEYRLVGRDGRVVWVQDAAAVVREETGKARFLHGIILDITERKRLESELQDEHNFALQIINTMGQGLTVTDAEGRFVLVNPAYARLFGYAPGDLLGKIPADLTAPDDREVLNQALLDRRQGKTTTYENRLRRKDGSYAHVLITGTPRLKGGQYAGAIAVITDVGALKQVEEALRQSEARYRGLVTELNDGVFAVDGHGVLTFANLALARMLGFEQPEQVVGRSMYDFITPAGLREIGESFRQATASGRSRGATTVEFLRPNAATVVVELKPARILEGNQVMGWRGVMRDVTERVQAEERAFELALERERMAVLSKFINDASHEFRTPLTIMQANLYLVERSDDPARRRQKLAQIGAQVRGIVRLVEELAEMAWLDSGVAFATQPADLNLLVGEVAAQVESAVTVRGLTLHLVLAPGLPPVLADEVRLGKALHELLDNALRFTPAGGDITVRTGWQMAGVEPDGKSQPPAISDPPSAIGNPQWVLVEVRDTGPGIPPDVLPHIFERFYRQDVAHSTPGFGLGLPIARAIVERHGGRLEVESEPGKGSVFRIVLPAPGAAETREVVHGGA